MAKTPQTQPHWFPFQWDKLEQPILGPSLDHFVSRNLGDPSVLYDGSTHLILFRGESRQEAPTSCVGRFGVGASEDGQNFKCQEEPILVPDSPFEGRGLAHPRLTLAGGVFLLTYSAFDGDRFRLCLATSSDCKHWFRHGLLFPEFTDNDGNTYSGSILPHPLADDRFYMYVGAGDLRIATSKNLIDWEMDPRPVLKRKRCPEFAAQAIDAGPSPFITKNGIVAILNATDSKNRTSVFAAMFKLTEPTKCVKELSEPFLWPEADWERFGYMPHTVRATGLTLIADTFRLYYGAADRYIAMATAKVPKELFTVSKSSHPGKKKRTSPKKK